MEHSIVVLVSNGVNIFSRSRHNIYSPCILFYSRQRRKYSRDGEHSEFTVRFVSLYDKAALSSMDCWKSIYSGMTSPVLLQCFVLKPESCHSSVNMVPLYHVYVSCSPTFNEICTSTCAYSYYCHTFYVIQDAVYNHHECDLDWILIRIYALVISKNILWAYIY